MSGRPWYKRYGGDFVLGTMSLSLEEKGAYSLCLDLIYDRGAPIPDDARWLAGVCGVSLRKWSALRDRLIATGKLIASDGHLSNDRAEKEIENALETSRKHAENGAKGGRSSGKNDTHTNENNELDEAGLKPNQKPEARDQKEEISEADASSAASADATGDEPKPAWSLDPVFVEAWGLVTDVMRRRSLARPATFAEWKRQARLAGGGPHLLAALKRYLAEDPDVKRTGGPGLHLWLKDGTWDLWSGEAASPAPALVTFPNTAVRATVVAAKDEGWARSYIDRCRWLEADKSILCPTQFVADQLRREVPKLIERGAKIIVAAEPIPFNQDRRAS